MTKPLPSGRETYLRLLSNLKPYRVASAVAVLCMLVGALSQTAFMKFLELLIDRGFKGEQRYIWLGPTIILSIFIVRAIAEFGQSFLLSYISNRVMFDLRARMFDRLLVLPVSYFDRLPSAQVITKLTADVNNIGGALAHVLTILVRDSLSVIAVFGYMVYLNWKLTLITLAIVPVVAGGVSYFGRRLREHSQRSQEVTSEMLGVLQEATDGQKVIKVYGGADYERERFGQTSNTLRGYAMRIARAIAASSPITQLSGAAALAGVVAAAIYLSTRGEMTSGQFTAFFAAWLLLIPPLKQLADVNAPLQRGIAAAESVFELIDAPQEADHGSIELAQVRGEIVFDHVSLRYENAERDSLVDVSLHVRPGESVALVGPSGGGKTSLANLVPRFYSPSAGRILIDGHPSESLRLASLRAQIALVSQDVVLFNDSIAANIAYGAQRSATRAEIEAAVRAAHLEDFVRTQPQGLDTQIGENGTRLSGGQRQRLAIARAVLKNAPILILDEATSALDSESERHVQAALEALMKGRTTIVIAHRLSTIEHCDRVLVLQKGSIVEQGTHAELIAKEGIYAKLHRIQYATQGDTTP